jgi:pyruvate,water dikinase
VELSVQAERFFGATLEESEDKGLIRGISGSPGVTSGVARLVLTLDEVDRLNPGEILVTYATAPPWTPLFGVVGGVVTDVGGRLSHCAIVAREYGIPAVVGTRVATARIHAGMRITVDGTRGIVRLEG